MSESTPRKTRVLVVDDSAVNRAMITDAINGCPALEVVATASNGRWALEKFDRQPCDLVTLDIQMPEMDGLETLREILARRPIPVIMVSSLTQRGAEITLEALELGAVDYLAKPDFSGATPDQFCHELIRKIQTVSGVNVERILQYRRRHQKRQTGWASGTLSGKPAVDLSKEIWQNSCIAIGTSTGGPPALEWIFRHLHPPMPPVVVVQHMPPEFTGSFADRLNSHSALSIEEARIGTPVEPNRAYIAPGSAHLSLRKSNDGIRILLEKGPSISGHRPSIDRLMESVANCFGNRSLGIIMTGMGRDGVAGCQAIRSGGGYVLGQDEPSSDVYGMNKVAWTEGHVDRQFPLYDAAQLIQRTLQDKLG
jgi:two-component system, chemotaxis family, protein-glutamate methylesterase/glutaminase